MDHFASPSHRGSDYRPVARDFHVDHVSRRTACALVETAWQAVFRVARLRDAYISRVAHTSRFLRCMRSGTHKWQPPPCMRHPRRDSVQVMAKHERITDTP